MKKTLRFSLISILMMLCGPMFAESVVTFSADTDQGTTTADAPGADQITKDGVTIAISNGAMAVGQYRVYKNQTFTVTSTVGNITKIEVTCTANGTTKQGPGCLENPSVGTYTFESDGKNGTWTGSATEVVFSTPTNQCRMTQVVVTVDDGEGGGGDVTSTVTISGTDNFETKTSITITGTGNVEQILYTVDGTDPTTSETKAMYQGAFEITETTTVKAVGLDIDDEVITEVVEKTFTKKEIEYVNVANIAAFNALDPNTENVVLTLTDAVVLGTGNNNIVVNDGTGGTDLYKLGVTVQQGSVLNGTVTGKRVDYNGITEMSNITANTVVATDGEVPAATAITVAEALAAENFAGLVKMDNATVAIKSSNNRYYAVNGTDSIQVYDNFRLGFTLAEGEYNIEGVIGAYKEKQIWLTKFESVEPVQVVEVNNIAELLEQEEGTEVKLNLTDAKVLYSWTSNNGNNSTYVRDASGAICFNRTSLGLVTDEDLNGFVYLTRGSYNNLPQANVSSVNETNADNLQHVAGDPAEATEIAISEAADNLNNLVLLKDVTITAVEGKYYANAGEDSVQVYNGFHLEDFEDLSTYVGEKEYGVKGIMVVYKTTYEIYPIEIYEIEPTAIESVEVVFDEKAPVYNLAGQRVNRDYKGVVIQSGKKFIQK